MMNHIPLHRRKMLKIEKYQKENLVLLKKVGYLQCVSLDDTNLNINQFECILTSMREQTQLKTINLTYNTLSSVDSSLLSVLTHVDNVTLNLTD